MLVIINVSKVVIDWSLTMRRKDYYDGRSHGRIYRQTNTCGLFTIRTMRCMSVDCRVYRISILLQALDSSGILLPKLC